MKMDNALHLEERAKKLVEKLNDDPESPWFRQIRMTGNAKGLISKEILIKKLKPLLSERRRGILHLYSIDEQFGILRNYFATTKIVFPNRADFFNQETAFNFLMSLLPTIFQLCLSKYNDFKIASISEILSCIKENHSLDGNCLRNGSTACAKEILPVINKCFKETLKAKL